MSDPGTVRVLLVDDQPLMRAGFRAIVERAPDVLVIGEAGDGVDGVRLAIETRPDVVLMDVDMPRLGGIEATRRLAGPGIAHPISVLMLADPHQGGSACESFRAGAVGFLLKDTEPGDLTRAIRVVAGGGSPVAPSIARRLITQFARGDRLLPEDDEPVTRARLTGREREVLVLVARGYSNRDIAKDLDLAEPTVKTHVGHLLSKLELRSRVQAGIFAYRHGLLHS